VVLSHLEQKQSLFGAVFVWSRLTDAVHFFCFLGVKTLDKTIKSLALGAPTPSSPVPIPNTEVKRSCGDDSLNEAKVASRQN
jgi:hypothetical protein